MKELSTLSHVTQRVAGKVLEVSIFWAGELFAVKRFAATARVTADDLGVPVAEGVVVRSELVDAGPRFARNRADLPLVAFGLVAALLNTGTVASFAVAARADASATTTIAPRVVGADVEAAFDGATPAVRTPPPTPSTDSRACPGVADYLRANHWTRVPP